jgi:ribose transport system permease protein
MASIPANAPGSRSSQRVARTVSVLQRQGALIALALLLLFGALRYDNFLSSYNIASVLRYNSMFGLIALGMTFVIMTGGIDLSVGSVAALSSVIAALLSPYGLLAGLVGPLLVGMALGLINGVVIARLGIAPFITTLAMLLAARGLALIFAKNTSVAVSYDTNFTTLGSNDLLGVPIPALILALAFLVGALALSYGRWGRHVLAVGGNEEAARLLGLPVSRIIISVYMLSGVMAALAGVILASQFGAGQPTEGLGWELQAIAAVVVGGTLLTGGLGSVWTTLVGVLLLGLIINMLNFEGLGPYWQSVIRGLFLLVVVVLQNQLARRRR